MFLVLDLMLSSATRTEAICAIMWAGHAFYYVRGENRRPPPRLSLTDKGPPHGPASVLEALNMHLTRADMFVRQSRHEGSSTPTVLEKDRTSSAEVTHLLFQAWRPRHCLIWPLPCWMTCACEY